MNSTEETVTVSRKYSTKMMVGVVQGSVFRLECSKWQLLYLCDELSVDCDALKVMISNHGKVLQLQTMHMFHIARKPQLMHC